MKNLLKALVVTLALNFLAVAGGVGWLWKSGKLDRKAVVAIKEIIFPKVADTQASTTQPTTESTTRPVSPLEALLARHAGTMMLPSRLIWCNRQSMHEWASSINDKGSLRIFNGWSRRRRRKCAMIAPPLKPIGSSFRLNSSRRCSWPVIRAFRTRSICTTQ